MDELSVENIQKIFVRQIMDLTKRSNNIDSFDYQFSDRWIR